MKFKDIVNREVVTLTNCEDEPIHIPGSIQPHGFLLGLKIADLTIDFCSGNSYEYIGLSYEQLLGKSFALIFGKFYEDNLQKYLRSHNHSYAAPFEIDMTGKTFNCIIHTNDNTYLLEFEPAGNEHISIGNIYQQTKQFTAYMQKANTLQMLCQLIADETREITGYDRVMIYKFDEDYNGEVFAESRIQNVEPFLGLHYPHTDIPVQARELYVRNLLRLIVDVNYNPVPIYTIDDTRNKKLDLSLSTLRSVSPIHIQYLHNMRVEATLTISLMHEDRLWGLISCHHYSPKYIKNNIRIAAQLQGHFLTSQINVRQASEEYDVAKKVNIALDELLAKVFSTDGGTFQDIIAQKELLTLTNAASVIMVVDDEIYSKGAVPSEVEIKKLINWLHIYSSPTGFNTANLSVLYPDAKKWCDSVSGIIFHSLGSGHHNCIIWCRPEALQQVNWAGNPEKAFIKDEKGLSPRKSFELWNEVKKCESNKWQKPELAAAANFANALQKHVHMMFLTQEELKQRKLSEKLKEANSELENLNWIASHDLKEPLRKIQLFASRILEEDHKGDYEMIFNSVQRMNESAKRMQLLISDILSYSRLSHIEEAFQSVNLNDLVQSIIDELSFEINEKKAIVEYGSLPGVKGIPFLLQQLFVNLIRNALKFSKVDTKPNITITYKDGVELSVANSFPDKFYKIVIQDNGIGFDNQFKDSIFKVFSRLHNHKEYSGSGVGLALCKKIMKNHGGSISAESTPDIGTTFLVYFPK
jgi:chemotaxis family two-component system sensor kinase Cph1